MQGFDHGRRLAPVLLQAVDEADGNAPSFPGCRITAPLPEWRNGRAAAKFMAVTEKYLPSPYGAIGSVSGSVKGYTENRRLPVIFSHTGQDMGKMMLDGNDGQPHFLSYCCRIIPGMKITGHTGRLYPEKCFHPGNSIAQGLYGPDISHIPDIRRQIIEPVPGEAETVFQFSSQCQDSPLFPSIEKRQRGIAAGTAYHIGTATVPVHNRIISPQTDPPVMAENGITHALQFLPCLFLVVAYGSSRCIGTGHDQRFRHLQSVVVGKEEQMKRRIREHNAQKGILRGQ